MLHVFYVLSASSTQNIEINRALLMTHDQKQDFSVMIYDHISMLLSFRIIVIEINTFYLQKSTDSTARTGADSRLRSVPSGADSSSQVEIAEPPDVYTGISPGSVLLKRVGHEARRARRPNEQSGVQRGEV